MRCPTLHDLPPPPPGKNGWPWTEESTQAPELMPTGQAWPRISIVTPSYNQGEFIEETIRSVLLQGYPDLEYIVIDGGSTNGSVDIIKRYERWLSFWITEKDFGQSSAINKGFSRATGLLLGYLNSDDLYVSNGLVNFIVNLIPHGARRNLIITSPVQNFFDSSDANRHTNSYFGSIADWIDGRVNFHQPGCLWSIDLWGRYGPFREDMHFVFEQYFFTLCRIGGARHVSVPTDLARFRLHMDSKTMQFQVRQDQFSVEWASVRETLQSRLSFMQQISVSISRRLVENWSMVSRVLEERNNQIYRKQFFRRIVKNPLYLLHRPVFSAFCKLAIMRIACLAKRPK